MFGNTIPFIWAMPGSWPFSGSKDPEAAVVCLMSGLYVQRGQPAVFSRQVRARAALLAGADLVLELPVTVSLPVRRGLCRRWCGDSGPAGGGGHFLWSRDGGPETPFETARQLLSPQFGGGSAAPIWMRACPSPPPGAGL